MSINRSVCKLEYTNYQNMRKSGSTSDFKSSKLSSTQPAEDKSDLAAYIKDDAMVTILQKKGVTKLFPIQYETFDIISKGEDVVAKDRTGSGKTLAFTLPIITTMRSLSKFKGNHNPKFLVVLPTRELAIQVKDEINSLRYKDKEDFTVAAIYGGSPIQEQLEIIGKGIDVVVGTPGRLIDFLNRGAIKLNNLETICLDQADEMLKIGFKQDIEAIFQVIAKAKTSRVQCLLFSATIPEWIWEISEKYQSKTKKFIDMMKDNNVRTSKTVEHYCLKASSMQKEAVIGSLIKYFLKGKTGKIIIFCETKREVDRIGNSGLIPFSVAMLHGDIKQFQRERVFKQFKCGNVQCLIATNVAARGLDFPEIDLIIQMQPPTTIDSYIHRSGRTGRAGKSGICVTFYSHKQEYLMKKIQAETKILLHHINTKDLKIPSNAEQKFANYTDQDSKERRYDKRESKQSKKEEWAQGSYGNLRHLQ